MRMLLALTLTLAGCFGDDDVTLQDAAPVDDAAPMVDVADAPSSDASDGSADASPCSCSPSDVCVQYRRHELRCIPLANVPAWDTGRCGERGQRCCPLLVPEVGIATDVCRPGLVCQVVGLLPASDSHCLP